MPDAPTRRPLTDLPKSYDPLTAERRWVERWVREPFRADPDSDKPPFTVVIPPPNVTGNLHLGHAFDNTLIDTLIRWRRMQGYEALYQPGMDHAGISTQVVVERALEAEGTDRRALGREAFLERVWAWKERYGGIIENQLTRLGVSADWTRSRFTMDEGLSRAVRKQFVELYHQGHVYRGERIVNWDPQSRTTLSDLEVDREERPGELVTLRYELDGGGELPIATVRPETIFADQAVAVHPSDERYAHLAGARVRIPLTDRWVPVIHDEAVEPEFGTGALKITPAHDATDFEIGERHGLDRPSVIDLDARLTGELVPARFRGMERFEARAAVVEAAEAEGTLAGREPYTVPIGLSQRTKVPVEPMLSLQWFYDASIIARRVLEGLDAQEIRVVPERYAKVNRDWLENLRPWNISRQLWWGHRIPAWYDEDGGVHVPTPDDPFTDPTERPENEGKTLTQDPDVFDTWFSSNLWPFSTLGWPDVGDPFYQRFYPTDVLVTGYDILFFWVARMEMAGYHFTGRAPFSHVMLHGLILDQDGQKMSKSKGNGVDPLDVVEESGADALRFAMTYASTGGQDIRWDPRRVDMGRTFTNKLWNAARFAFLNLDGPEDAGPPERLADRWILARLARATRTMTERMEAFDLGGANRAAYEFVWSEFCDWYVEAAKPALQAGDPRTRHVLRVALEGILRLLHPLLPFVTSELWEALGHEGQVAWAAWPSDREDGRDDAEAERDFARLQAAVGAVRALRAQADMPPNRSVPVHPDGDAADLLHGQAEVVAALARAELRTGEPAGASLRQVLPDVTLRLPLEGLIDVDAWRARQEQRLEGLRKDRDKSARKLDNEKFVANAPDAVVAEERRRLEEADAMIEGIERNLAQLG
ncbi:MAG: valine--tRNA ligase [Trueperaceae bacterium]|nr:valine--tRNA ligase [Trueperaceae bacterium]